MKYDKNKSNEYNETAHWNKMAFDEVIEWYMTLRTRSSVSVLEYDKDCSSSPNRAKPNPSDFFCDVEHSINTVIEKNMLQKVLQQYIIGIDVLDNDQKSWIEQRIGSIFRKRGLYPVHKYFTSIRKKNDN